jgi:hypothetical protein
MRSLVVVVSILLTAAVAGASGRVTVVDPGSLPPSCRWAATVPAGAPAYVHDAALTSAANCRAIALLRQPTQPSEAGARSLAETLAPSLSMLEDVAQRGDLGSRIIADRARADLLAGIAVKIASSVHRVGTMTGSDLATFQTQADYAFAVGQPWRRQAQSASRDVVQLGSSSDAQRLAAQNPVVARAIDVSRAASAPAVSRR